MSRYDARLLQLQIAAENCTSDHDRGLILGELAAMTAAMNTQDVHTKASVVSG